MALSQTPLTDPLDGALEHVEPLSVPVPNGDEALWEAFQNSPHADYVHPSGRVFPVHGEKGGGVVGWRMPHFGELRSAQGRVVFLHVGGFTTLGDRSTCVGRMLDSGGNWRPESGWYASNSYSPVRAFYVI